MGCDQNSLFGQCSGGNNPGLFVVTGRLQLNHVMWDVCCTGWSSEQSPHALAVGASTCKTGKMIVGAGDFRETCRAGEQEGVGEWRYGSSNWQKRTDGDKLVVAGWAETHQLGKQKGTSDRGGNGVSRDAERSWKAFFKLSASLSTLFHSTVVNFAASLSWFVCGEYKWDQRVAKVCMKCKNECAVHDK